MDDKNVVKYISELNRFFDEHKEYQIIHGHLSSLAVFYLGVAKKYNVPWRIAHSHGAGFLHTLKGTAKYLLFRTTKWNANVRLACSTEAGKYLYGKDTFEFVPNGIDVDRFTFDENKRIEMRKMLGIRDEYVIGHVGRFNLQKNHEYLLRIFKEVQQKTPNIKLLLLGEGELFSKIQNLAEDLEIKDKIIFAGVHKDVENYYQAMDAFVLPSLFEGLPVTGIEAQYSGLPCFFSDEVTREVKICSDTKFLKIGNENLGLWVDAISQQRINKERNKIELITKKFDIRTAAAFHTMDNYLIAFLHSYDYTENCYSCKFATLDRVSDITLGDSWGTELSGEVKNGVSLILCQSEKGKELIESAGLNLLDVDINNAILHNEQLNKPSKCSKSRDQFFENYNRYNNFGKALVKTAPGIVAKEKVKSIVKYIVRGGGTQAFMITVKDGKM